MINQSKFEFLKEKYGHYASWAIWAEEGEKPKDNTGDLSIFDIRNVKGRVKMYQRGGVKVYHSG